VEATPKPGALSRSHVRFWMPYRGVALQARILLPRLASVACLPLRARRSSRRRFRGVRVATRLHAPAGEQLDACMHACGQVEAAAERILHDDHINCLCVFPRTRALFWWKPWHIAERIFHDDQVDCLCVFPRTRALFWWNPWHIAERILHDDHINCLCVFSVHVLYFGENPDILLNAFCMMIKSTACASSP
jgi:uncharacterized protein involved in tolerance to divalent cations